MQNVISSEICQKCGKCCKNHPYVELSFSEIHVLELATQLPWVAFAYPKGKATEGYFLLFQANGDCYFLKDNDGCFSCGVYESRPGKCINYPEKPPQKEACRTHREKH